jgi:putative ABC transport system substrate-binding protein
MKRRKFITLLGGAAAAWPLAARAQQRAVPVIGYLSGRSPTDPFNSLAAFHRGLAETGFVEGRNVAIEYRWMEGHYDLLPTMLSDLVLRRVAVIATANLTASALAAKTATQVIPIVFNIGADPVAVGLVASLARPGGNVTGVATLQVAVAAKRLQLLRELLATANLIAVLLNPTNPAVAEAEQLELQEAARTLGLNLLVLRASTAGEIESAFSTLVAHRAKGLVVSADIFFSSRSDQIIELAARHSTPAIYAYLEHAPTGALMAYGARVDEAARILGNYTGRILNGERPGDLPVQQLTRVQLILNMKTAKALGLTFPITLLGRADEVIE